MEKEFVWTDELVFEFTNFYVDYIKDNKVSWTSSVVEQFKRSKKQRLLFTTEDGKEIYEGDKSIIWTVSPMFNYWTTIAGESVPVSGYKFFITENSAQEYVLMNKSCLSVSDIYNILTVCKFQTSMTSRWLLKKSEVEEKIKELAKQKIKP